MEIDRQQYFGASNNRYKREVDLDIQLKILSTLTGVLKALNIKETPTAPKTSAKRIKKIKGK